MQDIDWNMSSCTVAGDCPVVEATFLAKSWKTRTAFGPHPPPEPSATIGRKSKLSERQSASVCK
eukprot:432756-Karenia_brevis.AAC.1